MSDHQLALLAPKVPQVPRWTRDAYLCSKTYPDCRRCPIVWAYGLDPKNCKIPEAVAWLIFTGVPVPDLYKKEQGDVIEKKEKGAEYGNPDEEAE